MSFGPLKHASIALALMVNAPLYAAELLSSSQQREGHAGDVLQVGVPLAALALTFLLEPDTPQAHTTLYGASGADDTTEGDETSRAAIAGSLLHMTGSPRHDLALALGRSVVVTQVLKYSISESRPNGGKHSFPSGHTSAAFSGAEFIRREYGWGWGVPAYLTASYVGWSRLETHSHRLDDVLAGAAIGILSNHDLMELEISRGSLAFSPVLWTPSASRVSSLDGRPDPPAVPVFGVRLEFRFR